MKNLKSQNAIEVTQCGNCWGHQEYGNRSVEKEIEYQPTRNHAFILKFIEEYF